MVSPLIGGVSLLLMPPSFLRCTATERPVLVPPVWMVQRWQSHADGKNVLILSLWAAKPEHGCVGWRSRRSFLLAKAKARYRAFAAD